MTADDSTRVKFIKLLKIVIKHRRVLNRLLKPALPAMPDNIMILCGVCRLREKSGYRQTTGIKIGEAGVLTSQFQINLIYQEGIDDARH